MLDAAANTDVYAFTTQEAPGKVTAMADWVPLQNPARNPYFGRLDTAAVAGCVLTANAIPLIT